MILTDGVINGAVSGIVYGVPLVVVARWFPDRQGLAVGLTLLGLGLSPMVTAPLAQHLIAHDGLRPPLRLLAGVFTLVIVALASAFQLPPRSWHPSGPAAALGGAGARRPPLAGAGGGNRLADLLHCRAFDGLWICYVIRLWPWRPVGNGAGGADAGRAGQFRLWLLPHGPVRPSRPGCGQLAVEARGPRR